MELRKIILKLYSSFTKRVHSILLPVVLASLYLSAYSLRSASEPVLRYVTMRHIHFFGGVFLVILLVLIAYDKVWGKRRSANNNYRSDTTTFTLIREKFQRASKRRWLDYVFYSLLCAVCIHGSLIHIQKYHIINWIPVHSLTMILIHKISTDLLIGIIVIRYYLTVTHWFESLIYYLRTH